MSQPVVNMQERRQERTVTRVRTFLVTEVEVGGKWIRQEHELPLFVPSPKAAAPKSEFGSYVLSLGWVVKKSGPKKLDDIDIYELAKWHETWMKRMDEGEVVTGKLAEALQNTGRYLDERERPAVFQDRRRQ